MASKRENDKTESAAALIVNELTKPAEEVEKEQTAKTVRKTPVKKQPVMYVGPTLKNPPLIRNTVYNGIPEAAQEAMAERKELKLLFIAPDKYSVAEEQIRTRKGAYYAAFSALQQI